MKEIGGASAAPWFRWGLAIAAVLATILTALNVSLQRFPLGYATLKRQKPEDA